MYVHWRHQDEGEAAGDDFVIQEDGDEDAGGVVIKDDDVEAGATLCLPVHECVLGGLS